MHITAYIPHLWHQISDGAINIIVSSLHHCSVSISKIPRCFLLTSIKKLNLSKASKFLPDFYEKKTHHQKWPPTDLSLEIKRENHYSIAVIRFSLKTKQNWKLCALVYISNTPDPAQPQGRVSHAPGTVSNHNPCISGWYYDVIRYISGLRVARGLLNKIGKIMIFDDM